MDYKELSEIFDNLTPEEAKQVLQEWDADMYLASMEAHENN